MLALLPFQKIIPYPTTMLPTKRVWKLWGKDLELRTGAARNSLCIIFWSTSASHLARPGKTPFSKCQGLVCAKKHTHASSYFFLVPICRLFFLSPLTGLTSFQIIWGHNIATYVFISPSSFFPSITFFLAMLIVILLISSQGIQAMKEVKGRTLEKELERRDWQRPLSFLIWRIDSASPDRLADLSLQ